MDTRISFCLVFCVILQTSAFSQVHIQPGIELIGSKINWNENVYGLGTDFTTHPSVGLGVLFELNDSYSVNLHNVYYRVRYRVDFSANGGDNPIEQFSHRTIDTDASLSRKLGQTFSVGAGFKHLLWYDVTMHHTVGEQKYTTINGLGYHLQICYEHDHLGVVLAYNRVYAYKDITRPSPLIEYDKARSIDLRLYYGIRALVGKNNK